MTEKALDTRLCGQIDWFEGLAEDPASFPPLNDRQAQRAWLAGFLASWSEWLDCQGCGVG